VIRSRPRGGTPFAVLFKWSASKQKLYRKPARFRLSEIKIQRSDSNTKERKDVEIVSVPWVNGAAGDDLLTAIQVTHEDRFAPPQLSAGVPWGVPAWLPMPAWLPTPKEVPTPGYVPDLRH
jgi:hypothetical protein